MSDEMTVTAAVKRDLKDMPDGLAKSGLAATALMLAKTLDEGRGSPSECAKALTDVLMKLRELKPPEQPKESELDRIRKRRAQGSARGAAAKN